MKALSGFVFFAFFAMFSTFCQQVSAQCWAEVEKRCDLLHFDEECGGSCLENRALCGLYVVGDPFGFYLAVEEAINGFDEIDYTPSEPRVFCGYIKKCLCLISRDVTYCLRTPGTLSEYSAGNISIGGDTCPPVNPSDLQYASIP